MLERMDEFFARRLAGYDAHMLESIEGAEKFYPFTARQLPVWAGCRVLDLGCGTGLELEAYFRVNPRAAVTGIDMSEAMLGRLRAKLPSFDLNLVCGSYFDVPLGEERFDAAVSVESLHHFTAEQKLGLYRRLFAALKPGCSFILTDYFAESDEHERRYFAELAALRAREGITDGAFYHYDTPLTAEHEAEVLRAAGFADVTVLKRWGATCTVRAAKAAKQHMAGDHKAAGGGEGSRPRP